MSWEIMKAKYDLSLNCHKTKVWNASKQEIYFLPNSSYEKLQLKLSMILLICVCGPLQNLMIVRPA